MGIWGELTALTLPLAALLVGLNTLASQVGRGTQATEKLHLTKSIHTCVLLIQNVVLNWAWVWEQEAVCLVRLAKVRS